MRTILVVDDDSWLRTLVRDVLAGEGYRVIEASDAEAALRVAYEHPGPIHLLLTDIVMPGVNGCELAAGLSALRRRMKVLFMSAYDRDFLVERGLAAQPFIAKPFTMDYLARRVLDVLADRGSAAGPAPTRIAASSR